jgi:hypothetical protein
VSPAFRELLHALDGAVLTITSVEHDRCALRAHAAAAVGSAGGVTAAPHDDGTYAVRFQLEGPAAPAAFEFTGIALMLGGDRDVYFVQRRGAETHRVSRWRYEQDGGVSVSIYPGAFAVNLPPLVRALLPSELAVGTLRPIIPDGALA